MESVERASDAKIFFDGTTWRASCKGGHPDGVPVPRPIAYILRKCLYANGWFDRTSSRYRNLDYSDKAYREYYSYNCHRTALAAQGTFYKNYGDDVSQLAYEAAYDYRPGVERDIEKHNTVPCHMEMLEAQLSRAQPPCAVHIQKDNQQDTMLKHSFIYLGKDAAGTFLCFDKAGVRNEPFRVVSLTKIQEQYAPAHHYVAYVQPQIPEADIPTALS